MTETKGYGQAWLSDTNHPTNVMAFIFARLLAQHVTMKVVKVMAVTAGGGSAPGIAGTVDVLPLVDQSDGNGNTSPHGTVYGLPYLRLQGGTNAVLLEPAVGDIGLCVVSDRDISAVKKNKARSAPGSFRQFDLADGIYIGGILNAVPEQWVEFTADGIKMVDRNGNKMEMKAGSIAFDTTQLTCTGAIIAGFGGLDQVGLQTHNHPTAPNGPVSPPAPGS